MAQLVSDGARQLAQRRYATEVRELAALDMGIHFRALAVADVPDDAENLVGVTADDARFVEVLRLIGLERVLELLRLV